ncbi:MAG: helix-turn-helix transcriptional regulator [Symploca sp. SIO2G7]|nr:helix-turn-helix transcriptional regulator [Symploca sp. SIO2G7]
MKASFTSTDFQEAAAEFQQQTGSEYQFCGCEDILTLPKNLGDGRIRRVNLRDGLELFVQEHRLDEGLILEYLDTPSTYSPIALKFCLSGLVSGSIEGVDTDLFTSLGNHSLLYCPPDRKSTVELTAASKICTIELAIAPEVFQTMIDERECHSLELQYIYNLDIAAPYWQSGKTNSLMAIALQQILQCPYQGATRRLYLEGKSLELIALYLAQSTAVFQKNNTQKQNQLKPDDVSRIQQAKEILICHLENPPSLLNLARQVGLNDYKLKLGFRQVYGTTAFACLREHRMQQAKQLLETKQFDVATVAQMVGYASLSSFYRAFKKQFGMSPGSYQANSNS